MGGRGSGVAADIAARVETLIVMPSRLQWAYATPPPRASRSVDMTAEEGGLPASNAVSLERATPDMAPMLSNLLELYVHDLSEIFPVELGPEGRFGYEKLPLYWADPAVRHAFLIKHGSHVAGFVFATRGSPVSENPEDLDVAEFFVLRAYRRSGIGRQAAMALWDSVPGYWVVRVAEANRSGLRFWSEVIRSYTSGDFVESVQPGDSQGWRVFRFASTAWRMAF